MSHFTKFVNKHNLKVDKMEDDVTHLSMIGGLYNINVELSEDLHNVIRMCYRDNMPISIVERRTGLFRFFMDIDFISNIGISKDDMVVFIQQILFYLKDCFIVNKNDIEHTFVTYGYMATPRVKTKGNEDKIKTGCHIYIPNLHVESDTALIVRAYIISKIAKDHPKYDWEDIIDSSVYKNSGLRMIYTNKLMFCKCKRRQDCTLCTKGVVNEGGVYLPSFVLNGKDFTENKEMLNKLSKNIRLALSKASIRINYGESHNKAIINPSIIVNKTTKKNKHMTKKSRINIYSNGEESSINDCKLVESFIRSNFDCYKNITITGLQKSEYIGSLGNTKYVHYTISTDSKWCQNLNKSHRSNHVYFVIRYNGMLSQKCYCTCDTIAGRANGLCKDYESQPISIKSDTKLCEAFFSHKKDQNQILTTITPSDTIKLNPEARNKELNSLLNKLTVLKTTNTDSNEDDCEIDF